MEIDRIDGRLPPDALAVRREVFVAEQGVPESRELDGKDDEATHLVAADGDRPIGTARIRRYDDGATGGDEAAKVERVAIVEDRRGEGLGRELMDEAEALAAASGYDRIVLHAQLSVVPFYERLGYEPVGGVFEDAGIDHREMRKPL